jgi:hypothetical protein
LPRKCFLFGVLAARLTQKTTHSVKLFLLLHSKAYEFETWRRALACETNNCRNAEI